jgi:hypothetical protein
MKLTRKEWILLAAAMLLLAAYVIFFTDWFKTRTIHISHTVRPTRQAVRFALDTGAVITFGLDQPLPLTEIKVCALAELQTNRHPVPLWHLVSDSNSVPVRAFVYGQPIRGLHPFVVGTRARPLETNQMYRLEMKAGKLRGQHDFHLDIVNPAPQ